MCSNYYNDHTLELPYIIILKSRTECELLLHEMEYLDRMMKNCTEFEYFRIDKNFVIYM